MFSSLLAHVLPGHCDDAASGEARRHRHSGEEPHGAKVANGAAIRQAAAASDSSCDHRSAFPKLVSAVNQELLASGAVVLPGRASDARNMTYLPPDPEKKIKPVDINEVLLSEWCKSGVVAIHTHTVWSTCRWNQRLSTARVLCYAG